jgi:four helix bundle protein
MSSAPGSNMGQAVKRFTKLRAWQTCNAYKQAVYRVAAEGPLSRDWERRRQLEESVAGPLAHIAEGFGRFNAADFAKFTVIARSSLMESQDHLRDAVDKQYITEALRLELDELAVAALREVTGLMDYLQSAEALQNARRAREQRIVSRHERRTGAIGIEKTRDEPGTANSEPNLNLNTK